MARVFVHAKVRATWKGNSVDEELSAAHDLASMGVRLLIEELGTEQARRFLRRELSRYRKDYKGSGRDSLGPMQ